MSDIKLLQKGNPIYYTQLPKDIVITPNKNEATAENLYNTTYNELYLKGQLDQLGVLEKIKNQVITQHYRN